MPENKKQHFVPQFYLKGFSQNDKSGCISLFNISQSKYIAHTPIKSQAYKNYFYGKDLKREKALTDIEGVAASIIKGIIETEKMPNRRSEDHSALLTFILFQKTRTLAAAEESNELSDKFLKQILKHCPQFKDQQNQLSITLKDPTAFAMQSVGFSLPLAMDLGYKVLYNNSQTSFISSDNPVLYYNQFLETRQKIGAITGIACKGLQIFFPLSPKYCMFFYDDQVYKCGPRKDSIVIIEKNEDVLSLNLLQYISAHLNLYFDNSVAESYITTLVYKGKPFRRTHKVNIDEYKQTIEGKAAGILMHTYREDIRCSLQLSFTSINKKAKRSVLENSLMHLRNPQLFALHRKFVEQVKKGHYQIMEFSKFLQEFGQQ